MLRTRWKTTVIATCAVLALVGGACGGDDDDSGASETPDPTSAEGDEAPDETTTPQEIQSITLLLPGLPGPAAGGYVAAAQPEIASKHGLEIEIVSGGQGVFNTIPQVASGQAEFSLSSTPNLLSALAEDVPLVQVFAGYDYPTCLMYHEGAGIDDFDDLEGKTVAVTPGSAYWEYIKATYDLTDVTEVAYQGSIGPFAADQNLVQQCISLNEPWVADQEGIAHGLLMVSDSGFNPYQNVLFATADTVENDPDLVTALVAAVAEGWETYLAEPGPTNDIIVELGSTQELEQMEYAAGVLKDELFSGEIGYTDPDRVEELHSQMREVNVLEADVDWESVFSNDFLP